MKLGELFLPICGVEIFILSIEMSIRFYIFGGCKEKYTENVGISNEIIFILLFKSRITSIDLYKLSASFLFFKWKFGSDCNLK